jgi:tetratricopeptide (TPR) repeat protein
MLGDTDGELKAFQAALESTLPLNQPDILAWIYISLGKCYYRKESISEAIRNFSLAQQLFEEQQDTESLISAYRNLANAYEKIDDRMRAIDSIAQAISLANKVRNGQLIEEFEIMLQKMNAENSTFLNRDHG